MPVEWKSIASGARVDLSAATISTRATRQPSTRNLFVSRNTAPLLSQPQQKQQPQLQKEQHPHPHLALSSHPQSIHPSTRPSILLPVMLRQLSTFGLRQTYRLQQTATLRRLFPTHGHFSGNVARNFNALVVVRPPSSTTNLSRPMRVGIRSLSSSSSSSKNGGGGEEDPTKEIVLTPGQKVAAASRLTMWAGIAAFACACAYFIGKELLPTKMSPNSVFSKASGKIQENSQVQRKYGTPVKFYGKDHGGHREGRRNFIEHTQYTDPQDGSSRTRVRFNMEGQFDSAFCFAEVSSAMASGEFVYILVQDKRSGRVITVVDNRAALTAQQLAGGNKDTANAMQQLLGGSSSK